MGYTFWRAVIYVMLKLKLLKPYCIMVDTVLNYYTDAPIIDIDPIEET